MLDTKAVLALILGMMFSDPSVPPLSEYCAH